MPTNHDKKDQKLYLQMLLQQGYHRLKYGDDILRIEDILNEKINLSSDFHLLIDRLSVNNKISERLADSIQTAFHEGKGECTIEFINSNDSQTFNNRFELDGIKFEQPSIHLFTFNNPIGACKTCEGYGNIMGIDQDLVIPNTGLSIYEDAIACWRGDTLSKYKEDIIFNSEKWDIPIHKPYFKLSKKQKNTFYGKEIRSLRESIHFSLNLKRKIIRFKIAFCYPDTEVKQNVQNVMENDCAQKLTL